jgi:hypothetical protein
MGEMIVPEGQRVPPGRGSHCIATRYLVPGYYQPVPPGQKPFSPRNASQLFAAYGRSGEGPESDVATSRNTGGTPMIPLARRRAWR